MTIFQLLSRMPAGLWLRGIGALLLVVFLAVFGLALFAGVAALILLAVFGYKARDWLTGLFRGRQVAQPPGRRGGPQVIEAEYVIVDRRDRPR